MATDHSRIPGDIKLYLKYFLTEASTLSYCIVYVHYRYGLFRKNLTVTGIIP